MYLEFKKNEKPICVLEQTVHPTFYCDLMRESVFTIYEFLIIMLVLSITMKKKLMHVSVNEICKLGKKLN